MPVTGPGVAPMALATTTWPRGVGGGLVPQNLVVVSKPASAVPVPSPEPLVTRPTSGQLWPRGTRN